MTIKGYIKGHMELIISFAAMFIVLNLILFTSTPLNKSIGEIFYLDLLTVFILVMGGYFHYIKIKNTYNAIQKRMLQGEDINYLLKENSNVIGVKLMRQLIEDKDREYMNKEEGYQQRMNNLRDYITHAIHDLKVNIAVCEMVISRFEIEDERINKLVFQMNQIKFRINQLLSIARVNHFREDVVTEYVDIEKVVKEAINDNAEFFMSKGITIQVNLQPYSFISDKKWVHYIITQILNNSYKYTRENGEINIFNGKDDKGYYLHIKDNGIGICKEELNRVFDKGFTGSNGRENSKSTGMGLYYAKKIADILGIGIDVQSIRGEYTKFTLAFYKISDYINHQIN